MNGYVPKEGDKVRATLGESVVIGRVLRLRSINGAALLIDVRPAEDSFAELTLGVYRWQFEQVVSVPTKFGAVIRRSDGTLYVLAEPTAPDAVEWFGRAAGWATERTATDGGFTVLFEGVDE